MIPRFVSHALVCHLPRLGAPTSRSHKAQAASRLPESGHAASGVRVLATILALMASLVAAGAVHAQQVTAIRISGSPNATTSEQQQPEGAETIYVIFDYAGASNTSIRVDVTAPGNLSLFSDDQRYSGSGTSSVKITGADVYGNLGVQLNAYAAAAESNLQLAQSQQHSQTYLANVEAAVHTMSYAQAILERLPEDKILPLDGLDAALTQLTGLVEEASKVPADDDAARKSIAMDMEQYVAQVADVANDIIADANGASGVPLPPTGADVTEDTAYTVLLRVGGAPSRDAALWIAGGEAQNPDVGNDPTPDATRRVAATSTARTNAGPGANNTQVPGRTATTRTNAAAGSTPVASGIEATAPVMPLQGPTATEYARQQLATSGASSGGQPTAGDGAADTGGFGGQPPAGQPPAGDGRAAPQATWTLPVSEAGSTPGTQDGGSRSTSPEDRGSGPNVAILLIGLAALGVMAVFVRRRMI